jgi:HEAT repeat protein
MFSKRNWISKLILTACAPMAVAPVASAQVRIWGQGQALSLVAPDEARDIFNAGQRFFDEYKFGDAENRFREVVRRFPANAIADRADYYLIRTLAQVGKQKEALTRIDGFAKQYPKSKWLSDVEELRIELTNQIPAKAEVILRPFYVNAPPATQAPQQAPSPSPFGVVPPAPPSPPAAPPKPAPFPGSFQSSDPEVSLQQEVMRAMFRTNVNRAIVIATERLKADPGDPVVLSSLNVVAQSPAPEAMSMLLTIVKSSTNPKARRDAIFWLGQSRGDKDAIVDTIVGLMPTLAEDDSEAVAYTLSQIRSDKSINALVSIARDKNKSEKTRTNSVFWIGQSRAQNRVRLLDDIYKGSMDNSKIRQQVLAALSQTREPQAVTLLGNAASTDPDIEVRKQAVFWIGQSRSPEANQVLEDLLRKK